MVKNQLDLFEPQDIKPERKMYISSDLSESNISAFLQLDRNNTNVLLYGRCIIDYCTLNDMKVLKQQLFVLDEKEKKWFYKTPHNWKHYVLMMKQFNRYSCEQI